MLRVNRLCLQEIAVTASLRHTVASSSSFSSFSSTSLLCIRALSTTSTGTPPTNGNNSGGGVINKKPFGVSLRDSFRRVEQQRNEAAKAKEVQNDLLRSVTAKALNKHSSSAIFEVEEESANALTEGELRHRQQQQKLQFKREKLDAIYGPRDGTTAVPVPPTTQTPQAQPSSQQTQAKAQPQSQPQAQSKPQQQSQSQQQAGQQASANNKANQQPNQPSSQQSSSQQQQQQSKGQPQQQQQQLNQQGQNKQSNPQPQQGNKPSPNNQQGQQGNGNGNGQQSKPAQQHNQNQQNHSNNTQKSQTQNQNQNQNQGQQSHKPNHNHNNHNNGHTQNQQQHQQNRPQHNHNQHNQNNQKSQTQNQHHNQHQHQNQNQNQRNQQGQNQQSQNQQGQNQGQRPGQGQGQHQKNHQNQNQPRHPHQHQQNGQATQTISPSNPSIPHSQPTPVPMAALDIKDLVQQFRKKIETKNSPSAPSPAAAYHYHRQKHQQQLTQPQSAPIASNKTSPTVIKEVLIPHSGLTLRELASRLSMKISVLQSKLEEMGESLPIEDEDTGSGRSGHRRGEREKRAVGSIDIGEKMLDADVAELVVLELGLTSKRLADKKHLKHAFADLSPSLKTNSESAESEQGNNKENKAVSELVKRAPTVCVMGHVDHGKTTLLDALRGVSKDKDKKVAGSEAGGITQKLSAFTVEVDAPKTDEEESEKRKGREKVVFLDTPGHAAFSAMRGQGALATDIAILVVALDDGVQPQTVEALKTAKERDCAIVVALSKADKFPVANGERSKARSRVLAQLAQHELLTEDYGGDVQVVEVSGRTHEGVKELIDSLLVQAEVMDLKAYSKGQAEAVVLDAQLERGRGIVADVLVKWGALSVGDAVVVGSSFGRVKSMFNDSGKTIKTALPSEPVRLTGLRSIPATGSELLSLESEGEAKKIAERRARVAELKQAREQQALLGSSATPAQTEPNSAEVGPDGTPVATPPPAKPVLGVLLKADSLGSIEALKHIVQEIAALSTEEVTVKVLSASVGDITLSDVERVSAVSENLVLGFNIGIADNNTKMTAKQFDVAIHREEVIYRLEEELVKRIEELMPKQRVVRKEGSAKVLKVFKIKKTQVNVVAGLSVESGRLKNGTISGNNSGFYFYRVMRNGSILLEESKGSIDLKRFKDSVNEVESGNECGLSLEGFHDFQEGDEIECYAVELESKSLTANGYVPSKIAPRQA